GLFIAVFTVEVGALFNLLPSPIQPWFYFYGALLAFVFTGAGLVASFFHLGRPSRAWRAASQWRTSWLSREVIVLPAFMAAVAAYGAAVYLDLDRPLSLAIGALGVLLCIALFVCT